MESGWIVGRLKELLPSEILEGIARIFLKPVFVSKPVGQPTSEWLSYCFGIEDRPIRKYVATARIRLPGVFMENAVTPAITTRSAILEVGAVVLMRNDRSAMFPYEVEIEEGIRFKVYGLTDLEWDIVSEKLFCLDGIRFVRGVYKDTINKNRKRLVDAGCPNKAADIIAKQFSEAYDINFG